MQLLIIFLLLVSFYCGLKLVLLLLLFSFLLILPSPSTLSLHALSTRPAAVFALPTPFNLLTLYNLLSQSSPLPLFQLPLSTLFLLLYSLLLLLFPLLHKLH